jgi:quercetin dioxygenase-like cupin family protein
MTTTTETPTAVITTKEGGRAYWFLNNLAIDRTPRQGATPTVLEITIPAGGSPPLHAHQEEDDSFYVLDGRLAVRCGDDTFVATAGDYLALPKGVPHTFRVVDGRAARILMVHEDDLFLQFVQAVGKPAETRQLPESPPSVDFETLARASAEIARAPLLGPSMTEDEAQAIVARHSPAA